MIDLVTIINDSYCLYLNINNKKYTIWSEIIRALQIQFYILFSPLISDRSEYYFYGVWYQKFAEKFNQFR